MKTVEKDLITKHNNNTNQLTSSDVRTIVTDNTIIIYKNNNKKRITNPRRNMQKKINKTNLNKIAFNTGTNISNIFN